jgi:hypothetical protein
MMLASSHNTSYSRFDGMAGIGPELAQTIAVFQDLAKRLAQDLRSAISSPTARFEGWGRADS